MSNAPNKTFEQAGVTREQMEESLELAVHFRSYIVPYVSEWVRVCQAEGVDPNVIRLGIAAEAMILSSHAHIGTDTLFMRMAEVALGAVGNVGIDIWKTRH
jgi:hypothetical protein